MVEDKCKPYENLIFGWKVMRHKKSKIIITIFLLIPAILFISSYVNFFRYKIDNEQEQCFKRELITTVHQKSSFNMTALTPFEWDTMYVIQPYTSRTQMQQIVGVKWTTAKSFLGYLVSEKTWFGEYPLDDDSFYKLVFVKGSRVVLDVTLNRNDVDFVKIENPVKSRDAIFDIKKSNKGPIVVKH